MMLAMVMMLIAGVVLAMVLIENVLKLLLMMEQLGECKLSTAMAVAIAKEQSHTVLCVAVERGLAISIAKWAMALGDQQGTVPYWTPGTLQ